MSDSTQQRFNAPFHCGHGPSCRSDEIVHENPLARLARRARAVSLTPGLMSPAAVRADLLEVIERRGADDRDQAERRGTHEWRERVLAMSDEQIWAEYTHQWGDPPKFR